MTNFYGKVYDAGRGVWGFPFMVDSGTFWRCRHGHARLAAPCWRCGVFHPFRFVAHIWGWLS